MPIPPTRSAETRSASALRSGEPHERHNSSIAGGGLLLLAGLVAGTGVAIAATRTASSLLFGLKATDPVTIGLAIVLLGAVASAASFIPALRAARLEPMAALREE